MENVTCNGNRFDEMAELYDSARPAVPLYPVQILSQYLGRRPGVVVDLGCGPGISTKIWQGNCDMAIGVEPNGDMVMVANQKAGEGLRFIQAFGHETGLEETSVDIVTSSQAFHWMEPASTLREIHRMLVPGGIFATIDYEWPPVWNWKAELAFQKFSRAMGQIDPVGPKQGIVRWNKKDHMKHIRESGLFVYTRELFFNSTEQCSVKRLVDMALSRSSTQYIVRHYPQEAGRLIQAFTEELEALLGREPFEVQIHYRMRMGVKGE